MSQDTDSSSYAPFYGWLLIVGVIIFGAYLLWDFGLFAKLLAEDVTYLSSVILIFFCAITLYLGLAAWQLSRQTTLALKNNNTKGWAYDHLRLLQWQRQESSNESESLLARLVERIHRGHTSGWFFSDILMRLGLIGTVIGFVLMLSTVYQLKDNDVQALQQLLGTMGSGMQVALYTTLSGLGTAMLVSLQCQWLDRCADNLISQIIELGIDKPETKKST
ncbi:MAG: MotA/TolQ/ExbB proton channel family protein [Cocleimonas sp.]